MGDSASTRLNESKEPLLLGIDIGTSACKAALFRQDGTLAASASAAYNVKYPGPGWAEQHPEDWWQAVCKAIKELRELTDLKAIAGIGIDGQSWAAVAIDKEGRVLCPSPIWMDTRAGDLCEKWESALGRDNIFSISGNPFQPSYTLPKILWYKEHLPEVYKNTAYILQCNSFIVYRLTKAISQDLSQSYGLHCFNLRKGTYDLSLCKEMGIDPNILPKPVNCHQIVGTISDEAAKATGLPKGIPVVAGGLDAACGALGAGVLHSGQTQLQGGQAGGMGICISEYSPSPALIMSYHVVPGRWLLQGGTVGGGGALRWFREQFATGESFDEMTAAAKAVKPGADGLVFLPYMAGERSPIWDRNAKGIFYGLDYSKTKAHATRAVLEGVAFSVRHNLEAAAEAGAFADELRATGGAANSPLWMQIKSDITAKPIAVPYSDSSTTLGAAMLAGVAAGIYKNFEEAVQSAVSVRQSYKPNLDNEHIYNENYALYLSIYEKLRPETKIT